MSIVPSPVPHLQSIDDSSVEGVNVARFQNPKDKPSLGKKESDFKLSSRLKQLTGNFSQSSDVVDVTIKNMEHEDIGEVEIIKKKRRCSYCRDKLVQCDEYFSKFICRNSDYGK